MSNHDSDDHAHSREDTIYRMIMALMAADVVFGIALAGVGEFVLEQRPIAYAGLGLALVGFLLLLFFQRLGTRSNRRRR